MVCHCRNYLTIADILYSTFFFIGIFDLFLRWSSSSKYTPRPQLISKNKDRCWGRCQFTYGPTRIITLSSAKLCQGRCQFTYGPPIIITLCAAQFFWGQCQFTYDPPIIPSLRSAKLCWANVNSSTTLLEYPL